MGFVKFIKSKLRRKTSPAAAVDRDPGGGDGTEKSSCNGISGTLKLSWNEIEMLTRGFSVRIGYGGFSYVYLAEFLGNSMAVKLLHGCTQRLFQAFRQELEILRHVGRHDHIVNLLGYCDDREEGVLLFEYITNGTLQDMLHGPAAQHLPWRARARISYQLAQALSHLHDNCSPQIVHGDIKPSNILLDASLNCKLCDFGSAKMGFSSLVLPNNSNIMVGSPGYTDPLYLKTGLASKKNDIYSFGVVVLELVTGMEAVGRESGERLATRVLREAGDGTGMVDPRIRGEIGIEEVRDMVALARMCLCECANIRPSAKDILHTLRSQVPSLSFSCMSKKDVNY